MTRIFFSLGALSALISVATGAFGAHALRARLAADLLEIWETASRYQLYHALALLLIALASARWPDALWQAAAWLFILGTVLFSGSLYTLSLTGERWLGAVTPLGGVCFILGWALAALAGWRAIS